jgi:hypothetical protein
VDNAKTTRLAERLERELALQKSLCQLLDSAIEAARTRNLAALETQLSSIDSESRRAQSLARERESFVHQSFVREIAGARGAATLREIAERAGSARDGLLLLRSTLRDAAEAVAQRARRLHRVARELGDVYQSAILLLLRGGGGIATNGNGVNVNEIAASPALARGSLVNTEA